MGAREEAVAKAIQDIQDKEEANLEEALGGMFDLGVQSGGGGGFSQADIDAAVLKQKQEDQAEIDDIQGRLGQAQDALAREKEASAKALQDQKDAAAAELADAIANAQKAMEIQVAEDAQKLADQKAADDLELETQRQNDAKLLELQKAEDAEDLRQKMADAQAQIDGLSMQLKEAQDAKSAEDQVIQGLQNAVAKMQSALDALKEIILGGG